MERFSLLSLKQLKGDFDCDSIEIFKIIGINSLATDFCNELSKGHEYLEQPYILIDSLKTNQYILTDSLKTNQYVRVITNDGDIEIVNIHNTACCIRPVLHYSKRKGIPTNDGKYKLIGDNTLEVEYGYYPEAFVSSDILNKALASSKNFYKQGNFSAFHLNSSINEYPIFFLDDRMFIEYNVNGHYFDKKNEVFELKPVKWFVDLKENIMFTKKTLDFGTPLVSHEQSTYSDKHFSRTNMYKFLNGMFAKNLKQCIEKVHYIDLKKLRELIWLGKVEKANIEELQREFGKGDNLESLTVKNFVSSNSKENTEIKVENVNEQKSLIPEEALSKKEQEYSFQNVATMSGKFIQVVFNNKLYIFPLDNIIMSNIRMQDDVNFLYDFDNNIVRDQNNEEETFKINNVLRRAYINCLLKLNISEDVKKYIQKYDKNFEYNGLSSVTIVKTIVNELATIYYKEYTSKSNKSKYNNIVIKPINGTYLDKGLDDNYYENITSKRSK